MKYMVAVLYLFVILVPVSCRNKPNSYEEQLRNDTRFKEYVKALDDMMALRKQAFLNDPLWLKKQKKILDTIDNKVDRFMKRRQLMQGVKNDQGESLEALNEKWARLMAVLYRDYVKSRHVSKENFSLLLKDSMFAVFARYKNL